MHDRVVQIYVLGQQVRKSGAAMHEPAAPLLDLSALIDYHSLSLTNYAYFLFHLQHCLISHKKLFQSLSRPMLIV